MKPLGYCEIPCVQDDQLKATFFDLEPYMIIPITDQNEALIWLLAE